jgi:hypothetical protein
MLHVEGKRFREGMILMCLLFDVGDKKLLGFLPFEPGHVLTFSLCNVRIIIYCYYDFRGLCD